MPRVRPNISATAPFAGVVTDISPRLLQPNVATDVDNILFRDGNVQCRHGLQLMPNSGSVPIAKDMRTIFHMGGDADYFVATTIDGVYIYPSNEFTLPRSWTPADPVRAIYGGSGAIERYKSAAYLAFGERCYKYPGVLDDYRLLDVGMQAFDETVQTVSAAKSAGSSGMYGDVTVWLARYNKYTGVESIATRLAAVTGLSDDGITLTVTNADQDLVGDCTHIRIYASRTTGRGYPGLVATVPWESNISGTTWTYVLTTANGGSTYSAAADDTDFSYVPCNMNGLPPESVDIVYHAGRMFYLDADGFLWYSQNVEELQGGVEAVAATNYRVISQNEGMVALASFRDALYVLTDVQIHRVTGTVSSLTNEQIVHGSDELDDGSSDVIDPLEGTAGCVSRNSIIEVSTPEGNFLFYAGNQHIFAFDGNTAVPITLNRVQREYLRRVNMLASPEQLSVAHSSIDNCIVWCFKNIGCMVYDYALKTWSFWDTFPLSSSVDSDKFGPICTFSPHRNNPNRAMLMREDAAAQTSFQSFVIHEDQTDDEGVAFYGLWDGPMLTAGHPDFPKRWFYLTGDFRYKNDAGSVEQYVHLNEDTTKIIPRRGVSGRSTRTHLALAKQPFIRDLGCRALALTPHFKLAATSELNGYSLAAKVVGRR